MSVQSHWKLVLLLIVFVLFGGILLLEARNFSIDAPLVTQTQVSDEAGTTTQAQIAIPEPLFVDGWETAKENGYSFQYPKELPYEYIEVAELHWPPQLALADGDFACEEGSVYGDGSQTRLKALGDREYCVTTRSEGAAGNRYTTYAYVYSSGGRLALLRFAVRYLSCGNVAGTKKDVCETEQSLFDPDSLADRIAKSMHY